ncbi:MAG: NAD(P)/FAD-dependent oxidoreductase [Microscillaceae bacterium]|nr:NAD(P)/FAD-dependent oxidoreductase [Microscillaceae bacterium]
MKSSHSTEIALVGAGLCGSLLAIFLARRGFEVKVFEKRPDMRRIKQSGGRSINLALSHRGIRALEKVQIADHILQNAIPMYGRLLHDLGGDLTFVPYGKNRSEYINSISRAGLNMELMNIAESYEQVEFFFGQECEKIDFETGRLYFKESGKTELSVVDAQVIIGTDGAGSVIRQAMLDLDGYQGSTQFLEHGYKELTIPASETGSFVIEENGLHIWPRGSFMLIALPNPDGSFTCTLFLANQGAEGFEGLQHPNQISDFFQKYFPDAYRLMPDLVTEFLQNPVGLLGTVKCAPWSADNRALVLGDAAHAIVPFYGQGMNASFEDCLVLDQCIEAYGKDWGKVFSHFEALRKENTDAIAALAIENFYEMRDGVADETFLKVRRLEHLLENQYPDYHSKYSLVTFHPDITYAQARQRGNLQNEILLEVCRQIDAIEEVNLEILYQKLKEKIGF